MKKWLLLLLLLLCVGALTACGDKEETVADGQTLTLKVYNWGEYISIHKCRHCICYFNSIVHHHALQ